jgi:hypothetical protein
MECGRDVEKLPLLVTPESVQEFGLATIRKTLSRGPHMVAMTPVTITLLDSGVEGSVPYRKVRAYYARTIQAPGGKAKTEVAAQTDVLAYEGGHWRTTFPLTPSSEDMITRFAEFWKEGKTDVAARFLAHDAKLDLGDGSESRLADALAKLARVGKVVSIRANWDAEEQDPGPVKGEHYDVELGLDGTGETLPSGSYRFEVIDEMHFGKPYPRIRSIRRLVSK